MVTAVVIFILLTVVASLASWLFGQWLARRTGLSGIALAIGGGGVMLLIGAVAFVVIGVTTWWQQFIPVRDASQTTAPVMEPAPAARISAAASDRKAQLRAAGERYIERSEFAAAVELARHYLATNPADADMRSLLARATFAAAHPGSASIEPFVIDPDWPATHCVVASYSAKTARWVLDNYCDGVVAVAFQSCELGEEGCRFNSWESRRWRYQPAGILMTGPNDKPVALRVADDGPLVAPIFTIPDVAGVRRQIRYRACIVTAPHVLRLLSDSGNDDLAQQRLVAALRDDACYSQVLRWTHGDQPLLSSTGNQQ